MNYFIEIPVLAYILSSRNGGCLLFSLSFSIKEPFRWCCGRIKWKIAFEKMWKPFLNFSFFSHENKEVLPLPEPTMIEMISYPCINLYSHKYVQWAYHNFLNTFNWYCQPKCQQWQIKNLNPSAPAIVRVFAFSSVVVRNPLFCLPNENITSTKEAISINFKDPHTNAISYHFLVTQDQSYRNQGWLLDWWISATANDHKQSHKWLAFSFSYIEHDAACSPRFSFLEQFLICPHLLL